MRCRFSIATLAAAATVAVLAGCGGAKPVAPAPTSPPPSTPAPTLTASVPGTPSVRTRRVMKKVLRAKHLAPPAVQAKRIVSGSYPIEAWRAYLATTWKAKQPPSERWTAKRLTGDQWVARLVFKAPGHRSAAAWTILAPLGPHPAAKQVAAVVRVGLPPAPRDAQAVAFSANPPLLVRTDPGPIELQGVITQVDAAHHHLLVDFSMAARTDPTGSSMPQGRGFALDGLAVETPVAVTVAPGTMIQEPAGVATKDVSLATFATEHGTQPITVSLLWNVTGTQPTTLTQLLAQPVSTVEIGLVKLGS